MIDEFVWNMKWKDEMHGMWSYGFLEICVCWNKICSDDNALNLLWDWWNYMIMNQVIEEMVVACYCDYTYENEI